MSNFNSSEFGANIRKARKSKGLSQENLAKVLNITVSTIARYESGEIIPNAEHIFMICNELGIYEYELFNTDGQIQNKDNSKNPFKSKILYICYNAFIPSTNSYRTQKFKLIFTDKPDRCLVDFVDYKTNKVYMTGYVLADGYTAFIVFENYEPTSPRLEVSEIILNISNGLNHFIVGTYTSTNGYYTPSIRKCVASIEDFDVTDEVKTLLDISIEEINNLKENNILYLNTRKKEDYEN